MIAENKGAHSREVFAKIYNEVLHLEKPQLLQLQLLITNQLAESGARHEPHHADELGQIVKRHLLGMSGYERVTDAEGHSMVVKSGTSGGDLTEGKVK